MNSPFLVTIQDDREFISLTGISIKSLLSAELFLDGAGARNAGNSTDVATLCLKRWVDLAHMLTALPEPTEFMLVLGSMKRRGTVNTYAAFLPIGRGTNHEDAEAACLHANASLTALLRASLDYAELTPVTDTKTLNEIILLLNDCHTLEVRRRTERLRVSHGVIERAPLGFKASSAQNLSASDVSASVGRAAYIPHLFPWTPSTDSWARVLESLDSVENSAAVAIHMRTFERAPRACTEEIGISMAAAEQIFSQRVDEHVETVFTLQASLLRQEVLCRLAALEGRLIAARVFITSARLPSAALTSTVVGCLDEVAMPAQNNSSGMFRGGAQILRCPQGETLASLAEPSLDILFSPAEASSVLRTPMPVEIDLPGIRLTRSRSAKLTGRSGDDVPLGSNSHHGCALPVALDDAMRFRHTYVVGQTGSGKSTFLLHQILHDINRGRGVAVLDPHGSLIEQVLLHYPKERSEDLTIVDVTDVERPVGFNVLRINETDALQYRLARDIVVDDLHSYLERSYDINMLGPVFESHFRGMMSLLLGLQPQTDGRIPNLLVFRSLYTNRELRNSLVERIRFHDLMVDDFIREVSNSTGEMSLSNTASYVTSKFNRFVSDMTLRNITCQNSILDMDEVVNDGKVLLFYLGKGRFGDQAAGLLASQIVSRLRYAVMKRGTGTNVRPFYLYADEFQLFADKRFVELLAEARKFKMSLTLAHQYLDQLPPPVLQGVLGNVGTTIAFRVGAPDGERLESLFRPTFGARDLTSLPNFSAYIRSFGSLGHLPFSIKTEAPPVGGDEETATCLRQLARLKYGRDRRTVEDEIRQNFEQYGGAVCNS